MADEADSKIPENQQPEPDAADYRLINQDPGLGNPLNQCDHAVVWGLSTALPGAKPDTGQAALRADALGAVLRTHQIDRLLAGMDMSPPR